MPDNRNKNQNPTQPSMPQDRSKQGNSGGQQKPGMKQGHPKQDIKIESDDTSKVGNDNDDIDVDDKDEVTRPDGRRPAKP